MITLFCVSLFFGCKTPKEVVENKSVEAIKTPIEKKTKKIIREKAKEANAQKNDYGYLIGIANKASFTDPSFKPWYDSRYSEYTTDKQLIPKIKEVINEYSIKGFMGTWCGDSRREVPRFYKILEETNFNLDYFEMIAVGRNKKTPDNLQEGFNIIRVPTFIFLKDGKEVGRFVEYPRETLEKDLLKILSGETYKHSFDKSK